MPPAIHGRSVVRAQIPIEMSLSCTLNSNALKEDVRHFRFHQITAAIKHHVRDARGAQSLKFFDRDEGGVHDAGPSGINDLQWGWFSGCAPLRGWRQYRSER